MLEQSRADAYHHSPADAHQAALRSRVVAKLAGVPMRQLGRWHASGLIPAHVLPGAPGQPRLYSWVDYLKARAARQLRAAGVPPRRIHEAIDYLERCVPQWYLTPVYGFAGKVI